MKKMLVLLTGLLAGALVLTGCPTPDGGTTSDVVTGTINFDALNVKIAEAEKAKEGVVEAESAEEVAKGKQWVTGAVMSAFNTAIATARTALNSTTQNAVNNAVAALDAAITTFKGEIKEGNKTSGFTQQELTELIEEAKAAKEGVKISTDGKDVNPEEYWVSQSDVAALDSAINAANTPNGNINSAYLDLVQALKDFRGAQKPGTAGTEPFNPSNPIPLAFNIWAEGDLPTSNGEQWFRFTATANTQIIHYNPGTLAYASVQVYNTSGATVGSEVDLYGSTTYAGRTVTSGQEYYIRVRSFSAGTYKIAFNTSTTAPSP